jgi:hypothetical protein
MASAGALDADLLAQHPFYGTDLTKPLLFLEDGSYFDAKATADHLTLRAPAPADLAQPRSDGHPRRAAQERRERALGDGVAQPGHLSAHRAESRTRAGGTGSQRRVRCPLPMTTPRGGVTE